MNFVGSNNLNLKYQRFKPSGSKDISVRKTRFMAKTQFLCVRIEKLTVFLQIHIIYSILPRCILYMTMDQCDLLVKGTSKNKYYGNFSLKKNQKTCVKYIKKVSAH